MYSCVRKKEDQGALQWLVLSAEVSGKPQVRRLEDAWNLVITRKETIACTLNF